MTKLMSTTQTLPASSQPLFAAVELSRLLYSREEAAELLSVSPHTLARDVQLGKIRVICYGRRCLIPREEIMRIAAEGMA
jgi:excisionase family DNA binding protein